MDKAKVFYTNLRTKPGMSLLKKLRNLVKAAGIENINSTVIPEITFSQGYVTIYPTRIYTSEELLQYADKALYHVKENGRNDYLILEEEE